MRVMVSVHECRAFQALQFPSPAARGALCPCPHCKCPWLGCRIPRDELVQKRGHVSQVYCCSVYSHVICCVSPCSIRIWATAWVVAVGAVGPAVGVVGRPAIVNYVIPLQRGGSSRRFHLLLLLLPLRLLPLSTGQCLVGQPCAVARLEGLALVRGALFGFGGFGGVGGGGWVSRLFWGGGGFAGEGLGGGGGAQPTTGQQDLIGTALPPHTAYSPSKRPLGDGTVPPRATRTG